MVKSFHRFFPLCLLVGMMLGASGAAWSAGEGLRVEGFRIWPAPLESTHLEAMAHFEHANESTSATTDGDVQWIRFDVRGIGSGVLEWEQAEVSDWALWAWREGQWTRVADSRRRDQTNPGPPLRVGTLLHVNHASDAQSPFLLRAAAHPSQAAILLSDERDVDMRNLKNDLLFGSVLGMLSLVAVFGFLFGSKFRIQQLSAHGTYSGVFVVFLFLHTEWATGLLPISLANSLPLQRLMALFFLAPFLGQFLIEALGHELPLSRRMRWARGLAVAHIGGAMLLMGAVALGKLSGQGALSGMLTFVILAMAGLCAEAVRLRGGQMRNNHFFWWGIGVNGLGYIALWFELVVGWRLFRPGLSAIVVTAFAEPFLMLFALADLFSSGLSEGQTLTAQVQQLQRERLQAYVDGLEGEKRRVASELHDDVMGDLVLLHTSDGLPPTVQRSLKNVVRKLRGLSQGLNPFGVDQRPLQESLLALTSQYQGTGIQMRLHWDEDLPSLPASINFQLYRVAQEAVHNAFKHANASRIDIAVQGDLQDGGLTMSIEDDGIGFSREAVQATENRGQGIQNFEHRCSLINATLHIESTPGKGTYISVDVPMLFGK